MDERNDQDPIPTPPELAPGAELVGSAAGAPASPMSEFERAIIEPETTAAPGGAAAPVAIPAETRGTPVVGKVAAAGARAGADPWAHRRGEPRPWALMWTGYLLAATVACLGPITSAHFLTPDIYRPAAILLLVATALGVAVFWPMIRLSQEPPPRPASRAVVLDSIAIFFPLQATVWPQAMPALSNWDMSIAAAVAASATAWLALTGAVLSMALGHVASAKRRGRSTTLRRAGWMVVFLGLGLGASLAGLGTPAGDAKPDRYGLSMSVWSPASTVLEVTRDRSWLGRAAVVQPEHWRGVLVIAGIAAALWTVVLVREAAGRRGAGAGIRAGVG